jgi:tRNA dimethylallyltransferase
MGVVNKLLVLVGPTAVGKTSLSLSLAERFDGEIVSADSRLFYRGMDIGTAKPDLAERSRIPHHLIDICEPDRTVSLAEYQRRADKVVDRILRQGQLPILVGGTGQYVMAVVEGWGIPEVPPQRELRRELTLLGEAELSRWLKTLDAAAADKIDSRNIRRVVRALEVTLCTGRPISTLQRKIAPPYDICMVGLNREREALYERIDQRVEQMFAVGLVEEVRNLQLAGYGSDHPSMSGLGYRQTLAFLEGELTLEEAVQRIKFETHRFARQQNTWFRQNDTRIHWFDAGIDKVSDAIFEFVRQWLSN